MTQEAQQVVTPLAALKLALEALELHGKQYPHMVKGYCLDAITAVKEALAQEKALKALHDENERLGLYKDAYAQPEQEQNLKLMPREATPEMLKAMDECSMEGYDERLYAGHAGSVYMAAWDAFYGQHCYCGDITNLGVIHRDDGPCHYPEHTSEYKRGYADAMNWKVQNHLEHLPAAQPEQEPVAWATQMGEYAHIKWGAKRPEYPMVYEVPLYTTPPQPKELEHEPVAWEEGESIYFKEDQGLNDWIRANGTPLYRHPPQRTWVGLDEEDDIDWEEGGSLRDLVEAVEAKLKEKNMNNFLTKGNNNA